MTDNKPALDQSSSVVPRRTTRRRTPGRARNSARRAERSHLSGPVRVGSPAGVLAVVPHLLGFHPSRSLVVLGVTGPSDRVTMAFRYDLPDPPDAELAADIAAHAGEVLSQRGDPGRDRGRLRPGAAGHPGGRPLRARCRTRAW